MEYGQIKCEDEEPVRGSMFICVFPFFKDLSHQNWSPKIDPAGPILVAKTGSSLPILVPCKM